MREVICSAAAGGRRPRFFWGVLAAALLELSTGAVCAQDSGAVAVVVRDAWSRATPGGSKVGVGYLVIENKSSSVQQFTGAQSEIAGKTELHGTVESGGISRMSPIPNLTIPPGGAAAFEPSGRHVMFPDLKRPLKQGDRFRATLTFEPAGRVPVEFEVRGIGAGAHHAH